MALLINIGLIALITTFIAGGAGIIWASIRFDDRLPRIILSIMVFSLSVSLAVMIIGLVSGFFGLVNVYQSVHSEMSILLRLAALWSGQAGSLIFWNWLLAVFAWIGWRQIRQADPTFLHWHFIISAVCLIVFTAFSLFFENPFARYWELADGSVVASVFAPPMGSSFLPPDGLGMNPLLRHPGMLIHPPVLYLGYTSFLIPFAATLAGWILKREQSKWVRLSRDWTLFSWIFLSLGLLLGSWWSYEVLGWGGYWGWDPVEVSALLPWLGATVLLHGYLVESQRKLFPRFRAAMVFATFLLIILSVFLTRSGVLESVHAFGLSEIGLPFGIFFGLLAAVCLVVFLRWRAGDREWDLPSLDTKAGLIFSGNLLLIGLIIVCLWGLLSPLISGAFSGKEIILDADYYTQATAPLFWMVVVSMGMSTLASWSGKDAIRLGKSAMMTAFGAIVMVLFLIQANNLSGWKLLAGLWGIVFSGIAWLVSLAGEIRAVIQHKNWYQCLINRRRKIGASIIHLGVVVIGMGVVGMSSFQGEDLVLLEQEDSYAFLDYEIELVDVEQEWFNDREEVRAILTLSQQGRIIGELAPRKDDYRVYQQVVSVPDIQHQFFQDIYVVLVGYQLDPTSAAIRILYHPFIGFLWIGGVQFILGMLIIWLPGGRKAEAAYAG